MSVIVIVIIICVVLWFIRSYRLRYDTVIAFTGGLGSGKTYLSVSTSIKLLKRQRFKVAIHNFLEKIKGILIKAYVPDFWERPLLYSSIPVRISKKEWAVMLKEEHLLLTKKIVPRSIVLIDEIGAWAKQFDYGLPNIQDNFDEFVRFFRHYTLGGYLVCNDQCSENIVLYVRRRLNTVFNLMDFTKYLGVAYTVRVRNITISEEIKTIEELDKEDNMSILFGLFPFFKHYDTYCYSERYNSVPSWAERLYSRYKKNVLLACPSRRISKKTNGSEDGVKGSTP